MQPPASNPARLLKFIQPDETAIEYFKRHGREAVCTGLPCIDAFVKLRPGHVLEVVGPAGSAKTELLVQVCDFICPLFSTLNQASLARPQA